MKKAREYIGLMAVMMLGSSALYAASDPFKNFLENINLWIFVSIGPIIIAVGLGASALYRFFNEEKADSIFKNTLKAGVILTFATPIWAWFTGMFG